MTNGIVKPDPRTTPVKNTREENRKSYISDAVVSYFLNCKSFKHLVVLWNSWAVLSYVDAKYLYE